MTLFVAPSALQSRPLDANVLRGLPDRFGAIEKHVLAARLSSADEVHHTLKNLIDAKTLPNIDAAYALLLDVVQKDGVIVIVGDYDADGATALVLLQDLFAGLGVSHVHIFVPHRFKDGYGLTPAIVDAVRVHDPDLIITVDNGVTSLDGVARARKFGIAVLITDHHLPGDVLPHDAVVLNPNIAKKHPLCNLAGVGVAFYLAAGFLRVIAADTSLAARGAQFDVKHWLDLVAIGTIADHVPLDGNNRLLVQSGLTVIRRGFARIGVAALCRRARVDPQYITAEDIAFRVAPRLNAAGRMDDMHIGIRCLSATTVACADAAVEQLEVFNTERKRTERAMTETADSLLQEISADDTPPPALCLYRNDWHQGVSGILAGRLAKRLSCPVVVFAADTDKADVDDADIVLKGSVRSVRTIDVRAVLSMLFSTYPDMIRTFGGHAAAAGVSITKSQLPAFDKRFCHAVSDVIAGLPVQKEAVFHDGTLDDAEVDVTLAERIRTLLPYGNGVAVPQFYGEFVVRDCRIVGDAHTKLRLQSMTTTHTVDALLFGTTACQPQIGETIAVLYRLDVNAYNGMRRLQYIVCHVVRAE